MAITIKAKFKCSSEKISQVPKDNLINNIKIKKMKRLFILFYSILHHYQFIKSMFCSNSLRKWATRF